MREWREVALGDVAREVTVGHVGPMKSQYVDTGVPFLRSQDIQPHRVDTENIVHIADDFHQRLSKSALAPGDVVTVRTGKPGTTAVIPVTLPVANCSDLVITRVASEVDAHWLSYYINEAAKGHISAHLVGAVQQHFNVGAAKQMILRLPPLGEQQAIAEVLGSLDDKIAANTRMSKTAQELMVVLASQGSARSKVGEIAARIKTSVKPEELSGSTVDHYSLPAFDADQGAEVVRADSIKSNKTSIEQPCVLLSKLNPRIPRVWDVVTVNERPSLASTEFLVLDPQDVTSSVLWAALSQPSFWSDLSGMVAGTSGSHQRVRPVDVMNVEVIDPRSISEASHQSITALGERVDHIRGENLVLTSTRDALLPLLMFGKVTVKDAETTIDGVA